MAIRPIDGNAVKRRAWDIADAWKRQGRDYEALLLEFTVEQIVDATPTFTPPNEWVGVEEKLPENDGWYLVYAPGYWGNSKICGLDGLAYSNFKHNYKVNWGIERGTGRGWPGIVTHWTNFPAPPDRRPPEGEADA